jgi:hypothetical protein
MEKVTLSGIVTQNRLKINNLSEFLITIDSQVVIELSKKSFQNDS